MAIHSNILAWESPWVEEPGRLQSMWLVAESDTTERLPFHFLKSPAYKLSFQGLLLGNPILSGEPKSLWSCELHRASRQGVWSQG